MVLGCMGLEGVLWLGGRLPVSRRSPRVPRITERIIPTVSPLSSQWLLLHLQQRSEQD